MVNPRHGIMNSIHWGRSSKDIDIDSKKYPQIHLNMSLITRPCFIIYSTQRKIECNVHAPQPGSAYTRCVLYTLQHRTWPLKQMLCRCDNTTRGNTHARVPNESRCRKCRQQPYKRFQKHVCISQTRQRHIRTLSSYVCLTILQVFFSFIPYLLMILISLRYELANFS